MIVLDTHALLWWQDESPDLSSNARRAIESADRVGVPTACCLELATLARRGRIGFDRDVAVWLRAALARPEVEMIPLTVDIALAAGRLPESFPGDPVDRVVYATAETCRASLVTRDRRIRAHDPARVVW